eukprot:1457440-Rhodomonas_salina.2
MVPLRSSDFSLVNTCPSTQISPHHSPPAKQARTPPDVKRTAEQRVVRGTFSAASRPALGLKAASGTSPGRAQKERSRACK